MIITHVIVGVNPSLEAECLKAMNVLAKASRLEEGNVSYNFYKSIEEESTYILIEVWQSQEAVDSHAASEHFQAFMKETETKGYALSQKLSVFKGESLINQ